MALLHPILSPQKLGRPFGIRSNDQRRVDPEPDLADLTFEQSVAQGLASSPRRIASKWLYDDVGAALFEGIVASPGYYPARAELEILTTHGRAIAQAFGGGGSLVELGSGSSTKVRRLLHVMPDLIRYVPVDISRVQLLEAAEAIRVDYPDLEVVPIAADFLQDLDLSNVVGDGPVLGFFPGCTLCNMLPQDSEAFLRRMHTLLGPDSLFLVGVDLPKDEATLRQAYNDPGGAISDFNLNIVERMNRELGTALDVDDFRHEAIYNAEARRIEAAIYPLTDVSVTVAGRVFDLPAGQPIVLEYSYKYTLDSFAALAARAGWGTQHAWTDREALFSVHLLTNRAFA